MVEGVAEVLVARTIPQQSREAGRVPRGYRQRAAASVIFVLCLLVGCTGSAPPVFSTSSIGATSTPGTPLPSEAACMQSVLTSTHEQVPANSVANHAVPTPDEIAGLSPWNRIKNFLSGADALRQRITGDYTGTTDMIIQWVGCVWGIDPDVVRAQAYVESAWLQAATGDLTPELVLCPPGATRQGSECFQSYGLLQVKWYYSQSAWPMIRDNTAFSLEYAYGLIRTCYEGLESWLGFGGTGYRAGDLWGCLGAWFSGGWHTADANAYIASVQQTLAEHPWTDPGF